MRRSYLSSPAVLRRTEWLRGLATARRGTGVIFSAGLLFTVLAPSAAHAEEKPLQLAEVEKHAGDALLPVGADVVDYVLAAIDGEPVTARDLRKFMAERGQPAIDTADNSNPAIRQALRELVVEQVVEREAKASNIQVTEEEIHAYIAEIRRQNGVDEQGFESILRSRGIDPKGYEHQVTFDILKTRLLSMKVRAKIDILDKDVDSYVAAHPASGKDAKKHVLQAVLKPEPGDESGAERLKEKAERIRREVADGVSLEDAAGEAYSDLGFVHVPDLRDEFQPVVAKLKPGMISESVTIGGAVYLLQIVESGANPADEQQRSEAKKDMFEQRFREAADKYLNDELPKKYHVELKL